MRLIPYTRADETLVFFEKRNLNPNRTPRVLNQHLITVVIWGFQDIIYVTLEDILSAGERVELSKEIGKLKGVFERVIC